MIWKVVRFDPTCNLVRDTSSLYSIASTRSVVDTHLRVTAETDSAALEDQRCWDLVGINVGSGRVQLQVIDSGPGIDSLFQPHAFERFSRADESRARASGGSGLGLSIVSAVVQALQGTVTLDS